MSVLIFQIGLAGIQVIGYRFGGKAGLIAAYLIVILWTLTQTHSGLMFLQLIIQSGIGYYLLSKNDAGDETDPRL